MLWWLVDNATLVYFLLGIAALGLAALWWMNRRGKFLTALGIVIGLAALVWLLTRLIATDQTRLEQVGQDIALGIRKRNIDQVFRHISKSFDQANQRKISADELRELAKSYMNRNLGQDIQFSKFSFGEVSRDKGKAQVQFWVQGAGDLEGVPIRCEAEFVLEGNAWRMKGFKLFIGNTTNQYPFP